MLSYLIVCTVALFASTLTFFSGFGLGTLLLPAFALFFPVQMAVALTGVVHFLNGVFKAALVSRHANWGVVVRFGAPALLASFFGAWLLLSMSDLPPLLSYRYGASAEADVTLLKVVVGVVLIVFALLELTPRFQELSFGPKYMPLGGLLSGFFGGISGMQGALRSAFLVRAGLSKDQFIGTGVVIALIIDVARLGVYARIFQEQRESLDFGILFAATAAAFIGAFAGNRLLKKMTLGGVRRVVAVMLVAVGVGLVIGLL